MICSAICTRGSGQDYATRGRNVTYGCGGLYQTTWGVKKSTPNTCRPWLFTLSNMLCYVRYAHSKVVCGHQPGCLWFQVPWLRGRSTGILTLRETTRYSVSAIHVRTADQILMMYGTVCEALPVSQVMQTLTDKGSEVVRAPTCIKIKRNIAAFRTNSKKNFTHTVAFVERGAVHHHTSVTPGEVKHVHCLQSTRIGGHHWRHGYYILRQQLLVATIQSAR